MLDEFRARADELHLAAVRGLRDVPSRRRTRSRPATTTRPSASPTRPSPPGSARTASTPRSPTPASGSASPSTSAGCRRRSPRASGWSPPTRGCGCGRSPLVRAPRRRRPPRRRPRALFDDLVGARRRRTCATTRCSCPARASSSRSPSRSTTPSGRPCCGGRSSRTPARIAVSGLAGISIGPVSGYVGLAAHGAGDLDAAERHLR